MTTPPEPAPDDGDGERADSDAEVEDLGVQLARWKTQVDEHLKNLERT
ncbi:hypothetical protein [Streptomyces litchfieldiae]|uniref:Nucleotide exchange factor GrpE n=1 Tax=Streptomyces litchfieldiae TaxID=3075543 RepID=A0ABU2ML13_9ACTN|nr:hypothetical protein [Streptomyces sp. DSM 44938]MDT0342287.1 hypothetical protein [Streptomyces sp. DSM 44938]